MKAWQQNRTANNYSAFQTRFARFAVLIFLLRICHEFLAVSLLLPVRHMKEAKNETKFSSEEIQECSMYNLQFIKYTRWHYLDTTYI